MPRPLFERAKAATADYRYELLTGDQATLKTPRGPGRPPAPARPRVEGVSQFDAAAEYAALQWENEKIRVWWKADRITQEGFLRVGCDPLKPYTEHDVRRIMPHLNVFDRLAVLIDLDGVVKEGYMAKKEHENIKAVVEDIADKRVVVQMQNPEMRMHLSEIVREVLVEVFGEMRDSSKTLVSTTRVGGRQIKCSVCHEYGHRAPTCPKKRGGDLTPPADAEENAG